jgi:hypothetical protein
MAERSSDQLVEIVIACAEHIDDSNYLKIAFSQEKRRSSPIFQAIRRWSSWATSESSQSLA